MPGNPLEIGTPTGSNRPVILPASARKRHLYVCGGTGVGKSKFLEHCIRQDIRNWRDSGCGLILFDPHGLVYKNIMAWLAREGLKRPVVPIDLRRDDWIISYNLLRKRKESDPAVVVANFVRALSHVWGMDGTDQTPLFARWAGVFLRTLYENGYTISDVIHLLNRHDLQRAMSARLTDNSTQRAWQFAKNHPKEFENQITSTLNRFQRLLGPQVMKATLGQPDVSLDLLTALNEGKIILVNLSTEGGQIDEEDADTFGTLLLTDLWAAAKARGAEEEEKIRPFYVYIDECQNFVTPTIAKNLDQSRKFGLHLTLASQYPGQFLHEGASGQAMYDSVLANTGTKIVFRIQNFDDMKLMAQWLFMSTLDTDQVKLSLESTKVMDYQEEIRESHTKGKSTSKARSTGRGGGAFSGGSSTAGEGGSDSFDPEHPDNQVFLTTPLNTTTAWNKAVAKASGESNNWQESESEADTESESVTTSSFLRPVLGKEVSSVQFRTIDEQLFRRSQQLFDQADRNFVVRFHGGPKMPLFVTTPTVEPAPTAAKRIEAYRIQLLQGLPFALPMSEAVKRIESRERKLLTEMVEVDRRDEPTSAKRKIR